MRHPNLRGWGVRLRLPTLGFRPTRGDAGLPRFVRVFDSLVSESALKCLFPCIADHVALFKAHPVPPPAVCRLPPPARAAQGQGTWHTALGSGAGASFPSLKNFSLTSDLNLFLYFETISPYPITIKPCTKLVSLCL